ncbi:MAG TPA: RimK-like ATPgrasp N-terminal domain-containing protein [Trueperaceae bacterium]
MAARLFRPDPELGLEAELAHLGGDYSYMSSAYYEVLDAELAGQKIIPTTRDALDAYVVPIAMERARLAGMLVPEHVLATERFPEPPFMAYPVNPFSSAAELIVDAKTLEERRNGLTYTGKYAALCQTLPPDYRIDVVRTILGRSLTEEYRDFAREVFENFGIPLARVRVIVAPHGYLLSALEPLPFESLTLNEKTLLAGLGSWPS